MTTPKINQYSFGRMVVGQKEITSDLIIYPDGRIQDNWWRANGHRLNPDDIIQVVDAGPQKLIIGTGASGMMKVSAKVLDLCHERGIDVEACPTSEAMTRFNSAIESGKPIAACFHLTC